MNRVIEDVLRAFVNHKQDNWDKLLPLCEFAINSSYQSSTSSTPFYLNYGLNPKSPPDFLARRGGGSAPEWIQDRADAVKLAKDAMIAAQARQAQYADRGRVPSNLKDSDMVLLLLFGFI